MLLFGGGKKQVAQKDIFICMINLIFLIIIIVFTNKING